MSRLGNVLLVLGLGVVQLLILPDGHMVRPDNDTWGYLFGLSLFSYLFLSVVVAIYSESNFFRTAWRLSFLVYMGTIGSTMFTAPDIATLLFITSAPTIALRFLLNRSKLSDLPESI